MNINGATSAMARDKRIGEASCGAMRAATACCLAILELCVRAAGPVDGRIFEVFRQNTRVANTTEVRLLGGLTRGSDLHELLKNAQPSSTRLHFGEAQQRPIALLPFDQSGIDPRFEARRRSEILAHASHLLRNCSRARARRRSMAFSLRPVASAICRALRFSQ